MKLWLIAVTCLMSLIGTQAMAQTCAATPVDTRLTPAALQSAVVNKYVCVGTFPTATWNEFHTGSSGGAVVDYKLGPPPSTDPTATVGNYVISSSGKDGIITYNYTGGGSFSFYVQNKGAGQYYFCPTAGGGSVITATIQAAHC